MSRWIRFSDAGPSPSGKTLMWHVLTVEGDGFLGEVRWFARWRKYAFFPRPTTVFEQDCLRDIAAFCEQETRLQRLGGEKAVGRFLPRGALGAAREVASKIAP